MFSSLAQYNDVDREKTRHKLYVILYNSFVRIWKKIYRYVQLSGYYYNESNIVIEIFSYRCSCVLIYIVENNISIYRYMFELSIPYICTWNGEWTESCDNYQDVDINLDSMYLCHEKAIYEQLKNSSILKLMKLMTSFCSKTKTGYMDHVLSEPYVFKEGFILYICAES